MKNKMLVILALCLVVGCSQKSRKHDHQIILVPEARETITLDGNPSETCWTTSPWYPMDHNWVGPPLNPEDFSGRYKLCWKPEALYVLIEIEDDIFYDQYKDPLKLWWDDDGLEILIDEDNSGGLHQFNYNAFAYHLSLNGDVVDLGPDQQPMLLNSHLKTAQRQEGQLMTWELAVSVYKSDYNLGRAQLPVRLTPGKKIGFALAYSDNDGSRERENFIGSVFIPGEDKNQAWIDANLLGTLILEE